MLMRGQSRLHSLNFGIETWVYIFAALVLGFVVPQINQWFFPQWDLLMDRATVIAILSSTASGMITLSGLVFSLVFVLVQFGSATYSPRITRIFAHSYVLNNALGIFTGTFVYSLMALRTIGMESTERANAFTVWLAFFWLLASIAVLAKLIRVFTTLTVTNTLATLARVGRHSIERVYGPAVLGSNQHEGDTTSIKEERVNARDGWQKILYKGDPLYVSGYDTKSLFSLADTNDTLIYLPNAIGELLIDMTPIALVWGDNPLLNESKVFTYVYMAKERGFLNDPKFAVQLLVDTAIRALSPALNDPATAVQVLDYIEFLLRRLGNSNLNTGVVCNKHDVIRLIYATPSWEDYLQLAFIEIMHYGADSIQVQRRLQATLMSLKESVPPERAGAVELLIQQRQSVANEAIKNASFRAWADKPDRMGIGNPIAKSLSGSRTEE